MKMSRVESATRSTLAYYEALNLHDITAMVQLLSDDCHFESSEPAPDGRVHNGKEAIADYWQNLFQRVPRARFEIEEIFGLGQRCVARWNYTSADASASEEQLRGVDLFRVQNDAIIEILTYTKGN